ncbi:MAG: CDGSH iron-sulfur domain-containing protein [Deltaproteobacteria bacterium]|jgi:CDGSH-type Zn-finger protein|nr:CDGSH iron-sulfur domain-containing protein [Deltaproteobacteria bacterium]MBW2540957.1 CDGSH iron-sulfur domain-containing protein [Deltaproteobacteria bacterium]
MKIKLIENGPIIIETEASVSYSEAGSSDEQAGPIVLCRCGASARKPFCDGGHKKAEFKALAAEFNTR